MATYPGVRELEPEDEDGLEREIPGKVVENDAEGEGLEEIEEAKDDPVSQPLDVVIMARGLESLDRQVGGDTPADEVGHGGGECVDAVKDNEETNCANECVALGNLCPLFELDKSGVLGEL